MTKHGSLRLSPTLAAPRLGVPYSTVLDRRANWAGRMRLTAIDVDDNLLAKSRARLSCIAEVPTCTSELRLVLALTELVQGLYIVISPTGFLDVTLNNFVLAE